VRKPAISDKRLAIRYSLFAIRCSLAIRYSLFAVFLLFTLNADPAFAQKALRIEAVSYDQHANSIEPRTRRLVRAVFGNGPYVEGWAVYITRVLVEQGYLAPPGEKVNPKLLLSLLKSELRAVANAILDVRMHTRNMTDREAMDLMIAQTFQERAEAEAKLQRAKLSSTQLPTYFVGLEEWLRLREEYRKKKGGTFRLQEFHDRALDAGALPLPTLRRLMIQ